MAHRRPRCSRRRASASASSRSPTGTAPSRSARSAGRTCSSASPPATWTRWSTATPSDRRVRSDDAYTPGGAGGQRPDRAVIVYAQRCARGVPRRADRHRRHRGEPAPHRALRLLVGEGAPLGPARCARRTCWCTATASAQIVEIAHRLAAGEPIDDDHATCAARRSCASGAPPKAGSRSTRRTSMRPGRVEAAGRSVRDGAARRAAARAGDARRRRARRRDGRAASQRAARANADRERSVIRMPSLRAGRARSGAVRARLAHPAPGVESRQRARAGAAPRRRATCG